jgi:hypothetical protein
MILIQWFFDAIWDRASVIVVIRCLITTTFVVIVAVVIVVIVVIVGSLRDNLLPVCAVAKSAQDYTLS